VDARDAVVAAGLLGEEGEEVGRVDGHADVVPHDAGDFLLDDGSEDEDGAGDAAFAELEGLGGVADADHLAAGLPRGPGDREDAVAVGVGLDDGQHPRARLQGAADRGDVVAERLQVDLRPDAIASHALSPYEDLEPGPGPGRSPAPLEGDGGGSPRSWSCSWSSLPP
jgi:hypothetical protein